MATQSTGHVRAANTKDWSAAQYLKFSEQRTRPSRDLLAQVPLASPKRIIDIGCGPGNSTEVLAKQWPDAQILGMDSSPNMIETARRALPDLEFTVADLHSYTPEGSVDLLFSNAVFQWINFEDRIPIIRRLILSMKPGGVFALQVPDNYAERSHEAMRAVAEKGPWSETLGRLKPSLGPFQTPFELHNELKHLCSTVDIWHTYYQHQLGGHGEIVEWVKGTGLRPFIDPLTPEQKEEFLAAYLEKLKELYPLCNDGSVLLRYPRLFMVAK
ncbi:trans-aconitate 2-methyltransferase [Trichoderma cornu-damae]|uniref:Trans-aconitate 2-methyltransferase n=1 Tax=Trichoderma cornu-damae TaxID=654480 RepID=A0A9P8QHP7_9HYPO|nr:trans-aconitate 2-methyltransferase [Trichoderma cornu-damae]